MIKCCKDCVAPKRHIGCHGTCKEYLDEKAADEELKAKERAAREFYSARIDRIERCKDARVKRQKSSYGYSKFGRKKP